MKKRLLLFLILLFILPTVVAKQGHMFLLAVRESPEGYRGSVADLYLEIKPGNGRVFMETFPLSKLDTQISTRFAKEIACDYLSFDCGRYDFFYTIKAGSAIIGGPSAGAAIAVLTATLLDGLLIDERVTITGTINSGGLIGPVSGLRAKIDAAAKANISHVLIPKGERFTKEELNLTLDLEDYAEKYGIKVIEVADLTEALYQFTGKWFKELEKELEINKDYLDIMSGLAIRLCDRSKILYKRVAESRIDRGLIDKEFVELEEKGLNYSEKGELAFEDERYYSAASYCFGANLNFRQLIIKIENWTDFEIVEKEIADLNEEMDGVDIQTITDLEAYMVVKERLKNAEDSLSKARESYEREEVDYIKHLAKAIERIYSARSWAWFFGVKSKEFVFDKERLRDGCLSKISEAEERYQYAKLFFPGRLDETKKELDYAYEDLDNGDYELCLFKASKAKAEVDVILSVIGVEEKQIEDLLSNKLKVVKRIIIEQQEKGIFPVLGYSYYEYASSLKDDLYAALLYSEYALELSRLDLYFKEKEIIKEIRAVAVDLSTVLIFISGVLFGIFLVLFLRKKMIKGRKRIKRKKK